MSSASPQHLNSPDLPSTPRTPQPPFSPPRRHSSLAFSSTTGRVTSPSPNKQQCIDDAATRIETPPRAPSMAPGIASPLARGASSQLQRMFQVARGVLHRDVFAASSPTGSIESRMMVDQSIPLRSEDTLAPDTREWRYSTAPQNLATASMDVREPLPSPTLPDMSVESLDLADDTVEPVSSGFISPVREPIPRDNIEASLESSLAGSVDCELDLSTDAAADMDAYGAGDETGLGQPLHHLRVDDGNSTSKTLEDPSTQQPPRTQLFEASDDTEMQTSPHNSIYLSESAEAAANSAKAKRRWLRGIFPEDKDDEDGLDEQVDVDNDLPGLPDLPMICPNPMAHRGSSVTPCPEPSLHSQSPHLYRRPPSVCSRDVPVPAQRNNHMAYSVPAEGVHRATATGSPMPFYRPRSRCPTAQSDRQSLRMSPLVHRQGPEATMMHEHFQPGWYYSRGHTEHPQRPAYSFSTAASKMMGSDPAPDSRMRDSYKTDTLTALPVPNSRYRKNGIGADMLPRGVDRYYQRPPSSTRTYDSRVRSLSRQTHNGGTEVRFRSSPPRMSASDQFVPRRRKRAMDDSIVVVEDIYSDNTVAPRVTLRQSDDLMEVDEQTKVAVRMSIFGTNTPEALRHAREGIRELSPNVQLYRKGASETQHLRKKRRPSYWDNDLKEVRESPAGRGGVRSPVSAQESMRADFEMASQRGTETGMVQEELNEEAAGGATIV